jgi:hypothetical protein
MVHYALGQTYNKEGRQREAVSEFQKVISLKKDFYAVHVDLGCSYVDSADGTIDPSHIIFKFWGRDIYGNVMRLQMSIAVFLRSFDPEKSV